MALASRSEPGLGGSALEAKRLKGGSGSFLGRMETTEIKKLLKTLVAGPALVKDGGCWIKIN